MRSEWILRLWAFCSPGRTSADKTGVLGCHLNDMQAAADYLSENGWTVLEPEHDSGVPTYQWNIGR
jgi:hypothetical protein